MTVSNVSIFRLMEFIRQEADDENLGCAPMLKTIDLKMTLVLIGISLAFVLLTIPHRILELYAATNDVTIGELPTAITSQFCHINFSSNSIFYFFLASDCRQELKKTCNCFCTTTKTKK